VFLIDFGCSAAKTTIAARQETGDNYYFSPVRWLAENTNFSDECDGIAIDAWAAGLTLLELADRTEYPFINMGNYYHGHNLQQVQKRLSNYIATILASIPVLQNPAPSSYWSLWAFTNRTPTYIISQDSLPSESMSSNLSPVLASFTELNTF
jgi:hypothetical protein